MSTRLTSECIAANSLAGNKLSALPIMIGAIVPHAGNGFTFSNTGGGWEYPVFWAIALAVQAMLGDGAYAIGNPLKQKD